MNITAIRLQELRGIRGSTQEIIAEELGIEVRRWKSYEYGDRNMPFDILKAVSRLFNVTTDYLLGLSDEMQPQAKEFQQATGLSESAITNISKCKDSAVLVECMNQFLSSEEFINAISNLVIAKTPSYSVKSLADHKEGINQGLKMYKIVQGKKRTLTDEKIVLTGERLKEWEYLQASENLQKLMNRIVKGEKENVKC